MHSLWQRPFKRQHTQTAPVLLQQIKFHKHFPKDIINIKGLKESLEFIFGLNLINEQDLESKICLNTKLK